MNASLKHACILCCAVALALTTSCRNTPAAIGLGIPGSYQRSGEINLELATSELRYATGDLISVEVTPAEDCYLTIWSQPTIGSPRQLYPNAYADARVFRGGVTAEFPGTHDFQLRAEPPAGREAILVFASGAPFEDMGRMPEPYLWTKKPASSAEARRGFAQISYEIVQP